MVCPDASGYADTNTDCDDTTALFRGAPWFELCDDDDNDCDGVVDENPRAVPWYEDGDRDGFGDPEATVVISCAPLMAGLEPGLRTMLDVPLAPPTAPRGILRSSLCTSSSRRWWHFRSQLTKS